MVNYSDVLNESLRNVIDTDELEVTWTPSNYIRTDASPEASSLNALTAHLNGIDNALASGVASSGIGVHDNTYHTVNYEPEFTKNTAFNKDFGTTSGTVAEGIHIHGDLTTAYAHSQITTGNPHSLDSTDIGLSSNQIIDHSTISVTASGLLSGGGILTTSRTIGLSNLDINHNQISNTHNLTTDINHNSLTNTHQDVSTTASPIFSQLLVNDGAVIHGNLVVSGTTFVTQHETVEITDNIFIINNGEVGPGVTSSGNIAGIEVDRGSSTNYRFVFDETIDAFIVGEIGDLQPVATRENTPNNTSIPFWNSSTNRFETNSNFTYNVGDSVLSIGEGELIAGSINAVSGTLYLEGEGAPIMALNSGYILAFKSFTAANANIVISYETADAQMSVTTGGTSASSALLLANGNASWYLTTDYTKNNSLVISNTTIGDVITTTISGNVFIGDTSNAFSTKGLTINQGTNGDNIISLKSSDIIHPFTALEEEDTYGTLSKISATLGGVRLRGISDGDFIGALIGGLIGSATPTYAGIVLNSSKTNGSTGVTSLAATEKVVEMRSYDVYDLWDVYGNGDVLQKGNLTLNSDLADATSTLTFGRTTGGNGEISYDGTYIDINKKLVAGDLSRSTLGQIIISGKYTSGSLAVFGTSYSSGAPFIGYCVNPSLTTQSTFISSTEITASRGAIVVDSALRYFAGDIQTVSIGGLVSTTEVFTIESTGDGYFDGNLTLNSDLADATSKLIFGRTTGGNAEISYDGTYLGHNKVISVSTPLSSLNAREALIVGRIGTSGYVGQGLYSTADVVTGGLGMGLALRTWQSNVGIIESMYISHAGKVGIGTTIPVYKLVVSNEGSLGLEIDPTAVSGTEINILSYNRSTSAYKPLNFYASENFMSGSTAMTSGWNRVLTLASTYPVLVFNSNSTKWAGMGYDGSVDTMRFFLGATSSDVTGTGPQRLAISNSSVYSAVPVGIQTEPWATLSLPFSSAISFGQSTLYNFNIYKTAAGSLHTYFDSFDDNASANVYFRMRTSGTPIDILTLAGSGQIGINTASFIGTEKLRVNGHIYSDYSIIANSAWGFKNNEYVAGFNPIWCFANATTYGLGYYQRDNDLLGIGQDAIGFHFGSPAAPPTYFGVDGTTYTNKIKFPATQVASTDANTLDDYEEGTWTPSLIGTTSGYWIPEAGFATAYYVKIGIKVHIQGMIQVNSSSSPSGGMLISLPFTVANLTDKADYTVGSTIFTGHGGTLPNVQALTSGDMGYFYLTIMTDSGATGTIGSSNIDSSWSLWFSFDYIATT